MDVHMHQVAEMGRAPSIRHEEPTAAQIAAYLAAVAPAERPRQRSGGLVGLTGPMQRTSQIVPPSIDAPGDIVVISADRSRRGRWRLWRRR